MIKKVKRRNNAVTEMVGTMLLSVISVAIFSVLYLSIVTVSPNPAQPSVNLICTLDNENITLEHRGGETLDLETVITVTIDDVNNKFIVDNYIICEENEADTILSAVKYIQKIDPDIICTVRGDSFLLPYLYHRANIHGLKHGVNLGREYAQKLNPSKQAKSYFSYGQIIYRPAFYTLKGRIHIDSYSSFMYGESGLSGLVDISRCSNIPIQLLSRLGPGTAISQMQVNKALEKGYLIPWKKNKPESIPKEAGLNAELISKQPVHNSRY